MADPTQGAGLTLPDVTITPDDKDAAAMTAGQGTADPFGDLPKLATAAAPAATAPPVAAPDAADHDISPGPAASDTAPSQPKADHFADLPDLKAPHDAGLAANIGAGTSEAVAGTLGAPVDLATGALNLGTAGINKLLGTNIPPIQHPFGGHETFESAEGLIGADPRKITPTSAGEEVGRAISRGAASMAIPGGIAKAVPKLAGAAAEAIRGALASGATPSGAIAGGVGGGTGQVASDIVPAPYKGLADVTGNLIGGGATALAERAAIGAGRALVSHAAPSGAPILDTETGTPITTSTGAPIGENDAARAGQRIANAAHLSPENASLSLSPEESPIEGFEPTLGQSTGDLGVLAFERELRNRYRDLFIAHDSANNAALLHSVGQLAPEDAATTAGRFVRSNLSALDAADAAERASLLQDTQGATQSLGGTPAENTQTDLGAEARTRLEAIRQPLKLAAGRALDAVDPDGTLALSADPVANAARGLLGDPKGTPSDFAINAKAGETLAGPEQPVLNAASNMKGVTSFRDLRDLLGQTSAAQRAIRADPGLGAESRPYARMRVLRQSIGDAMTEAASDRAVQQTTAAEPETTPTAATEPVDDLSTLEQNLAAARGEWYGGRNSSETGGNRQGSGRNAGTGSGAIPGVSGAQGTAGSRSASSTRISAVPAEAPPEPLEPNFDQDAADRLRAANEAYADYKTRFRQGPVGEALASGNTPNGYRLGDSQVVSRLFRPGPQGADAADSLIRAAGSPQRAAEVLGDYPAYSLRLAAAPDGVLNTAKYARWMAAHSEALSRFPDLRAKFSTAGDAAQALEDSAVRAREARSQFQDTALRHYANVDPDVSPQVAIDRLMRTQNPSSEAADLMKRLGANPDVVESVQRNAVDWVLDQIKGTAESGTTGEREISKSALQRLLEKKPAQTQALRTILGPQRFEVLERVSDALDLAARSYQAVGIKGSPGTAADLHALGAHEQPSLLFQAWLAEKGGDLVSHLLNLAGPIGAAVRAGSAVGAILMRSARTAGMDRADQLAVEGVLHPELGRILLGRAAVSANDPRLRLISRQLSALALAAHTTAATDNQHPQHARGGRVVSTEADLHAEATNAHPQPSPAQKEAGNYQKAHVIIQGLPITIENAKGSIRSGVAKDGKPWSVRMPVPYGYLKGPAIGMDGEKVDCYVGPHLSSKRVFVIDQVDADTKEPDEHKVMIGFPNRALALATYYRAFSDHRGPQRIGHVAEMSIDDFKHWLEHGDTSAPIAEAEHDAPKAAAG